VQAGGVMVPDSIGSISYVPRTLTYGKPGPARTAAGSASRAQPISGYRNAVDLARAQLLLLRSYQGT
jgi:hypothetical protein